MLTETLNSGTIPVYQKSHTDKKGKYLFHPIIDFLCLGGGSLTLFAVLAFFVPLDVVAPTVSAIALALTTFINLPHFAHSYQIFYQNYSQKLRHENGPRSLQIRYFIAGIVIPIALLILFFTSVKMNDSQILGFTGNIMLFFVGWHYVKQGYGIMIVDSVLKRRFFSSFEKKTLLANAYVCWIFFWLLTNWTISEENFFGLRYAMFNIPTGLLYSSGIVMIVSTGMVASVLTKKRLLDGIKLPLNGTVAYFTALYVWLALRLDPFFIILIPISHSLQYLIVVWRFQLNKAYQTPLAPIELEEGIVKKILPSRNIWKFVIFVVTGLILGYLLFWTIPQLLDSTVHYNHEVFGETMFMFMFWIFINIHHYFIDNVIWRRENPDTKRYLFSSS